MPSINPAIRPAILIMKRNVDVLKSSFLASGTRSSIRRQAIACKDAMNLAYEASVKNDEWRELERLVDTILLATANHDLRTKESVQ
jgi:hypothetical protein